MPVAGEWGITPAARGAGTELGQPQAPAGMVTILRSPLEVGDPGPWRSGIDSGCTGKRSLSAPCHLAGAPGTTSSVQSHCTPQISAESGHTWHCNLAGKIVQVMEMEMKPSTRCGGTGKDSNAHQPLLGAVTCCSDSQGSLEGAIWDLKGEMTSTPQHIPSRLPAVG